MCKDYIKVIAELEHSIQEVIMTAIQELMTPTSQNDQLAEEEKIEGLEQEIHDLTIDKKELANKCRDLESQVASLQEELASSKELLDRYSNTENIINDPSTDIGYKFQNLYSKVEQLQKENLRLESGRYHDYIISPLLTLIWNYSNAMLFYNTIVLCSALYSIILIMYLICGNDLGIIYLFYS